jgi:hypothetical protein
VLAGVVDAAELALRRIGGRQAQAELCWPAWLTLLGGIALALCRIGGWLAQAKLR